MTDLAASDALPKPKRDLLPVLLPVILALAMLPLIGSASSWVTLTVASLAMGMMIFIMASGLTLVFGLMDVLNFGHGAFIAVGAYIATLVLLPLAAWVQAELAGDQSGGAGAGGAAAMAVSGALGLVVERVLILPVYGQHLKQILMTTGGLIVAEQALYALWGPQIIPLPLPTSLRGSFIIGDVAIAKYRAAGDAGRPRRVPRHSAGAEPHQDRPADPRRRREPRDGGSARLSHPPAVPRRVHGRARRSPASAA